MALCRRDLYVDDFRALFEHRACVARASTFALRATSSALERFVGAFLAVARAYLCTGIARSPLTALVSMLSKECLQVAVRGARPADVAAVAAVAAAAAVDKSQLRFHALRSTPSATPCGLGTWCVRWRMVYCRSSRRRRRWLALLHRRRRLAWRVCVRFCLVWSLGAAPHTSPRHCPPLTALAFLCREECLLEAFRRTWPTGIALTAADAAAAAVAIKARWSRLLLRSSPLTCASTLGV